MELEADNDDWMSQTREMFESQEALELSLVELVLAATELTEDETEVSDFVDAAILSGRVQIQVAA